MTKKELTRLLSVEVQARIAKYHGNPPGVSIEEADLKLLLAAFPIAVILQAMKNMRGVLRSRPHLSNDKILHTVRNIAQRVLMDGKSRGRYTEFSGINEDGSITPFKKTPRLLPVRTAPHSEPTVDVDSIRLLFQEKVTQQDWTLTEIQVAEYLSQAGSADVLCEAIGKLTKYPVSKFEEGLSALSTAIDQTLWMREAGALQC